MENEIEISDTDSSSEDKEADSDVSETDGETDSSLEGLNVATKITYHLDQEKSISLQKTYLCHMCGSLSQEQVATASSDLTSLLCDLDGLKVVRKFEGHTKSITSIRFNPCDPFQLLTSSIDGTIKFWDIRKPGKSAITFKDDTAESGQLKPFLSFDVSKSGHFLCAGTELFDGDAFLVFGDARTCKVLGGYWESHSDDITQVAFHPVLSDCLASGSSDGLINIYDLKTENEDDALINSLNTESSVDRLNWYLLDGCYKGISCILDTMDVQMWIQDGASPSLSLNRIHIAKTSGVKADECYVVNIHQADSEELLFLIGGSDKNSEYLSLAQLKKKTLTHETELPGNKQRVRCSWYNNKNSSVISAGESGIISVWKLGSEDTDNMSSKLLPKKTPPRSKPY